MVWIFIICFVVIVLNCVTRHLIHHIDALVPTSDYRVDEGLTPDLLSSAAKILDTFGVREQGIIPDQYLPLGVQAIEFIENYASVDFGDGLKIYERSLLSVPYTDNVSFLQIGVTHDGDYILIKKNDTNEGIYIVNTDEGDFTKPEPYASSITNYILMEYKDFLSSEK